ncbi:MAG: hypothetical protein EOP52_03530 [Sphingobacteriales bacterium]|nr:MAG: hypothetical protein EOP52_03530 [Sphingobacteriales bacterium]
MKQLILIAGCILASATASMAQQPTTPPAPVRWEYKQISTIESVVPGGMGRSRLLTTDDNGQNLEKELKNFYSLVGINFENISNNDRVIVGRINELAQDGWELFQATSGSNMQMSQGSSSGGLFITRYLFRRLRP